MPREIYVIKDWSGGLADDPAARDIKIKELAVVNNADVSKMGILPSPGGQAWFAIGSNWYSKIVASNTTVLNAPGYGLYMFGSDHGLDGDYNETYILAIAGNNSLDEKTISLIEIDGTTPTSTRLGDISFGSPLTSTQVDFYPAFYYVDGGLRISEGNLNFDGYDASNIIIKYIDITPFSNSTVITDGAAAGWSGSTGNTSLSGWMKFMDILAPPNAGVASSGLYGLTGAGIPVSGATRLFLQFPLNSVYLCSTLFSEGHVVLNTSTTEVLRITGTTTTGSYIGINIETGQAGDFATDGYMIFPGTSVFGINILHGSFNNGDGTWETGLYEYGITWLYFDYQESPIYILEDNHPSGYSNTIINGHALTPKIYVNWNSSDIYNSGIIGGRVYIRKMNVFDEETWKCIYTFDIEKGICVGQSEDWYKWGEYNTSAISITSKQFFVAPTTTIYINEPPADTYESINGIVSSTAISRSFRFKTAIVANRRVYIGNVLYDGEYYPDSIFKSKVNKFDIFDVNDRIDVVRGDGDSIVKLEEYADRILEFKKNKLYIINIAQEIEFLEGQFDYRGIDKPYHAIRTEYGIVWFNDYGCYLFDGQTVIDLFVDPEIPSRRKISLDNWRSFLLTTPSVGYDARYKKAIFVANSTTSGLDPYIDMMIYDFMTSSWVKVVDGFGKEYEFKCTNIITSPNGYPIAVKNSEDDPGIIGWYTSNVSSSSNLNILSGDIDFDAPGIKKNIVSMHITYKGSNLKPYFIPTLISSSTITTQYWETTGASNILPSAATYTNIKLTPENPGYAKNIDSIQIGVASATSAAASSYSINDISIVYRKKGLR